MNESENLNQLKSNGQNVADISIIENFSVEASESGCCQIHCVCMRSKSVLPATVKLCSSVLVAADLFRWLDHEYPFMLYNLCSVLFSSLLCFAKLISNNEQLMRTQHQKVAGRSKHRREYRIRRIS